MTYQKVTGPLMANSHPGSYCGQDTYSDMLVTERKHGKDAFLCRGGVQLLRHWMRVITKEREHGMGRSVKYWR